VTVFAQNVFLQHLVVESAFDAEYRDRDPVTVSVTQVLHHASSGEYRTGRHWERASRRQWRYEWLGNIDPF
jgi:hypothetical protein